MIYNDAALITGIVGDFILQMITKYHPAGNFAGLKDYFNIHGSVESLFIAGGMLAFFGLMMDILIINKSIVNLIIVGAVLDIIFRFYRLFPSLDGYYAALSIPNSIIWGSIPMVMPLILVN